LDHSSPVLVRSSNDLAAAGEGRIPQTGPSLKSVSSGLGPLLISMKVLVACEFTGVVRDWFLTRGHDAYSCDLIPSESSRGPHIQGNVLDILDDDWDLMIAHPPCTYLCNSGVKHLFIEPDRYDKMIEGIKLFQSLLNAPIPRICIENPIMHRYAATSLPHYTQIVHPWWFGEPEKKSTCLWLIGLPELVPTDIVIPYRESVHRMAPGPNRGRDRSRTPLGLGMAMVESWG
jgi:hypothetical protein